MNSAQEIRLIDRNRDSLCWYELMKPTQCAVLMKYRDTTVPLSPEGSRFNNANEAICVLFDRLDDARKFCELKVQQFPFMCCEIFDSAGKAKPPLLVVMHPSLAAGDEASDSWKRKRNVIAIVLLALASLLFWIDWRDGGVWIVPTILGINMILEALRYLHFNFWIGEVDEDQAERLKAHLEGEDRQPSN